MSTVFDAISKFLNQPWDNESIRYSDGMTAWEINAFDSRQFLWILGRHPLDGWPPILDLQFNCSSVRESVVMSYQDGKATIVGKVLILQSSRDGKIQSETWLYLWPSGRLEVNVCIASDGNESNTPD